MTAHRLTSYVNGPLPYGLWVSCVDAEYEMIELVNPSLSRKDEELPLKLLKHVWWVKKIKND